MQPGQLFADYQPQNQNETYDRKTEQPHKIAILSHNDNGFSEQ